MVPGAPHFVPQAWGSWEGGRWGRDGVGQVGRRVPEHGGAAMLCRGGTGCGTERGAAGCHLQGLQHLCPLGAAWGPGGWRVRSGCCRETRESPSTGLMRQGKGPRGYKPQPQLSRDGVHPARAVRLRGGTAAAPSKPLPQTRILHPSDAAGGPNSIIPALEMPVSHQRGQSSLAAWGRGLPAACSAGREGFHPSFVLSPLPLLFLAGEAAAGPGGLSIISSGFCQAALR